MQWKVLRRPGGRAGQRVMLALGVLGLTAALALAAALPALTPPPTWAQSDPTQADPAANPAQSDTPTPAPTPTPTPISRVDYDTDDDALIEVNSLLQLDAIRFDLNGDGIADSPKGRKGQPKAPGDSDRPDNALRYRAAFPNAAVNMGCPNGCAGYELTANITFDTDGDNDVDLADGRISWNDGAGWIPLGSAAYPFTAEFNGNFHTISRLFSNNGNPNAVGLFGVSSGDIQKLYLAEVNIAGSTPDQSIGGLVGYNNRGEIRISSVTGQVRASGANADVGGLVGNSNRGYIYRSFTNAAVSSSGYKSSIGGLVGESNRTDIQDSYAQGAVSVSHRTVAAGGLVGYNNRGTVTTSSASGAVTGTRAGEYIRVGGLVGYSKYGIIAESYASGPVSGTGSSVIAGGLVATVDWSTIAACYASGAVSATGTEPSAAGGLVGYFLGDPTLGGRIEASYARSRVSQNAPTSEIFVPGGLVGLNLEGDVTNSYWDTAVSGQSASGAGTGKTTAELQAEVTYQGIYRNWNLDFDGDGDADNPWKFPQSQYPDTRRTAPVN